MVVYFFICILSVAFNFTMNRFLPYG